MSTEKFIFLIYKVENSFFLPVSYTHLQVNADLADAVENSGDPERQADIARNKLGLVEPGEQVIYFTD